MLNRWKYWSNRHIK